MVTRIRPGRAADLDALARIEAACFPPAEAAGRESLRARLAAFPDCFFVAEQENKPVGFINGCCTDGPVLPDALYDDVTLHQPDGAYQTVFGLDVLPEYRRQGIAWQLLSALRADAVDRGRTGMVLTCKDHLISYYTNFGFVWQGVSASVHGGAKWNDMLLKF